MMVENDYFSTSMLYSVFSDALNRPTKAPCPTFVTTIDLFLQEPVPV